MAIDHHQQSRQSSILATVARWTIIFMIWGPFAKRFLARFSPANQKSWMLNKETVWQP
jgi:hypothetical protein